jgi:hypothetical protein
MTDNTNLSARIERFVPQHFLEVLGKNLPALLKAINSSNAKAEAQVQACIDNLFLSTANGKYLVQLGEEQGFTMPANSGLDLRAYRVLVPIMVSNPKQVRISINELIQAFYGSERTKPSIESSIYSPYSLADGDDLVVTTESGSVDLSVLANQVSDITSVSAQELAAIINSSQSIVLAQAVTDRAVGLDFVRISSNTPGSGAFIRVSGGTLQNILKFPNVLATENTTGTTWNITRTSLLNDEVKFTWNGLGTNPKVYLAKKDDVVTIRGLVDGVADFSLLNGSYTVVDSGYDYFIIRNDRFDYVSAVLTQNMTTNIVFTENRNITIFDRDEYALSSETTDQTITITVPAVPPLARRFLSGSAHLRGGEYKVIDFTRSSVQISTGSTGAVPNQDNQFVLSNPYQRYDFKLKHYKTILVDTDTVTPTYLMETGNDDYAVFPYTSSTNVSTDPIYGSIDSDEYKMTFPYPHGLQKGWGFTIDSAIGISNITSSDLNSEHVTKAVLDKNNIKFTMKDTSGVPKVFDGIGWAALAAIPTAPCDVIRYTDFQPDGADFYLQFPSSSARIATGLTPGTTFRLSTSLGTDVDPYFAGILRYTLLTVTSATGSTVNFSLGQGPGGTGTVITGISGRRSGYFGGTVNYRLDKTSPYNQERVFADLKGVFISYSASQNPDYIGSFIFDPVGSQTAFTVSQYIVKLTDNVLKGDNLTLLKVDRTTIPSGKAFPSSGQIVLDYGNDNLEGPIRYFAVIDNTTSGQILIDPAYRFKKAHAVGANVQYIHANSAYAPSVDGADYPVYITGTTAARNTLFALIRLLVASGIFVESDIILPNLRNDDLGIVPFD